ncbi:MAG: hypothetical protein V1703_00520 [Candidatus Altiarchaeota archaeon]
MMKKTIPLLFILMLLLSPVVFSQSGSNPDYNVSISDLDLDEPETTFADSEVSYDENLVDSSIILVSPTLVDMINFSEGSIIQEGSTMPESPVTLESNTAASSASTSASTTMYTSKATRKTSTTIICGGDENICYVDFDITGDNQFECCTPSNHLMCELCFTPCADICHNMGHGVKYCFGSDLSFSCECTENPPSCYTTTTTATTVVSTTYAGLVESTKENKPLFYIIVLVVMVAIMVAVIYYVRKI